MDTLEQLFASPARARLLKLFLMNPEMRVTAAEASRRARVRPRQFAAEARRLSKIQILRRAKGRGTGGQAAYTANRDFPLFAELRNLILKSAPHAKGQLAAKIRRLGNIKLALLSGAFIDSPDSRVDLLLVGDGFRKARLKSFIQRLESQVGRELNYVAMSSAEFRYRRDMYDRFIRDTLELPHETLINKLGV